MVISWVVAQFGGFVVANRSDCWWCRYAAPELEESLWDEILRLGKNFLSTWTTGYMAYDDHQWALLPLLEASMLIYILLFATMFMRFRYRMVVYVGMILYFHQDAAKDVGKSFKIRESCISYHFYHYHKGPSLMNNRDFSNASSLWHASERPLLYHHLQILG